MFKDLFAFSVYYFLMNEEAKEIQKKREEDEWKMKEGSW